MEPNEPFQMHRFRDEVREVGSVEEVRALLASVPASVSPRQVAQVVAEHSPYLEMSLAEQLVQGGASSRLARNAHLPPEILRWFREKLASPWGEDPERGPEVREATELLLRRGLVPAGHALAERVRRKIEEPGQGSESALQAWGRSYLCLPGMDVPRARAMLARFSLRWGILSGGLPHLGEEMQRELWGDWYRVVPEDAERFLVYNPEMLAVLPEEVLGRLLGSEEAELRLAVIRQLGQRTGERGEAADRERGAGSRAR